MANLNISPEVLVFDEMQEVEGDEPLKFVWISDRVLRW